MSIYEARLRSRSLSRRGGVVSYTAFGSDFDGSNDNLTTGAGLTGAADKKTGLFSAFVRLDGGNGSNMSIIGNQNLRALIRRGNSNTFDFLFWNPSNTVILDINTVATFQSGPSWIHLLAAWDLGTAGRRHIFIDGVEDTNETTFTDNDIDYTVADWGVGALPSGSTRFNGCLSEVYFTDEWLDPTVEANRLRFRSAAGKPVSLGADGSLATGTQPLIYLNNTFGTFQTNKGSGGNFTVTGALDACSSSPSD